MARRPHQVLPLSPRPRIPTEGVMIDPAAGSALGPRQFGAGRRAGPIAIANYNGASLAILLRTVTKITDFRAVWLTIPSPQSDPGRPGP